MFLRVGACWLKVNAGDKGMLSIGRWFKVGSSRYLALHVEMKGEVNSPSACNDFIRREQYILDQYHLGLCCISFLPGCLKTPVLLQSIFF